MTHFHQLLFNVALTPDVGREQPFGGKAAGVVVGLGIGQAVTLVGVEHPVVGVPGLIVVVDVAGPPADVPVSEFLIVLLLIRISFEIIIAF